MKFRVVITDRAAEELESAADWWADHRSVSEAGRWYAGFSDALYGLSGFPERCPVAAENGEYSYELRELHYGLSSRPTHRAVFTIINDLVVILSVRHSAQDRWRPKL